MSTRRVAPYGSWSSPITSDLIVSESIRLEEIAADGQHIYWIEGRPVEGGRNVIVHRSPDGQIKDVTPAAFNARTRVHEYGGGAFLVAEGTTYFSNFADQRLYCLVPGQPVSPMTPELDVRYADGIIDPFRKRIVCIREDHTTAAPQAVNTIAGIDLHGDDSGRVLASGNDFYSSPRLSPDGTRLAWLTWNHPNMPWDGTELWAGQVATDGAVTSAQRVAGGIDESIFQPEWSPDGILHFVSDRTGWWNLYRWKDSNIEPLMEMQAEFGRPQWAFGMSTYAFESARRIVCCYTQEGVWHLAAIDTTTGQISPIEIPYNYIQSLRAMPGWVVLIAGSPTEPNSVVQLDLATQRVEVLRRSTQVSIDPAFVSLPEPLEFPTAHGQVAHALFYPPKNPDSTAPSGEKSPLLVMSHGGPTSATSSTLNLSLQYWTSRGIAVLDVNYGGSTGYGRSYRQRLDGAWGVVDVDDCANGALYLASRGLVDPNRLAIRGGSAGGYTTLSALAFRDVFKAGASYYGISDLEALARETHKFESRYLDRLIGPYPQARDVYQQRSPINHTGQLSSPLIVFQGLEDRVVPPNQAELIVEAVKRKGLPVAYLPFPGEQHGFRQAENMKRALDAELYFYSKVFGFELADPVEPVDIHNLD